MHGQTNIKYKSNKKIALFLGPLAFLLIMLMPAPEGLSHEGKIVMASTIWMAIWWITEPISIFVTALLPIILFSVTGALPIKSTTGAYGHKYIFLFLGGFLLAIAIEKWQLHRRIALKIIQKIGTNANRIILGFMVATAFLSMWISNTATTVMMLPIGMAVVTQFADNPLTPINEHTMFGKALMLAIAYSASIGGIATLVGTPPNLVLAGVVKDTFGYEIGFGQWMMLGLPISLILLGICWKYLTGYAFDFSREKFAKGKETIEDELTKLGHISYEEKVVGIVFLCTALAWIFRSKLQIIIPHIDDTIIAMISGVILFVLPAQKGKILSWKDTVHLPWGILILFGGGMALSVGFNSTGLAEWIGHHLTNFKSLNLGLLILFLIAAVNFLTEITSNVATTAMLLPILAPLATVLGVHPYFLMISATLAASCAFMLPVATPPNAVVFGSGYLKISDMVKAGVFMNLISIAILWLFIKFGLAWLWTLG